MVKEKKNRPILFTVVVLLICSFQVYNVSFPIYEAIFIYNDFNIIRYLQLINLGFGLFSIILITYLLIYKSAFDKFPAILLLISICAIFLIFSDFFSYFSSLSINSN